MVGVRQAGRADLLMAGMGGYAEIALPAIIGNNVSLRCVAALLGMLNSCASNIATVNIDNGFGAGYLASVIKRL